MRTVEIVTGTVMAKTVPAWEVASIPTVPWSFCTMWRTTSRPTPRPETSPVLAVVKPGRNRYSRSSASLNCRSAASSNSPACRMRARMRS